MNMPSTTTRLDFLLCAIAAAALAACGGSADTADPSAAAATDQQARAEQAASRGDDDGDAHDEDADDRQQDARGRCEASAIQRAFRHRSKTTVLLAKAYKQGEPLVLSATPATPPAPTAAADVCFVKLLVGPGSPGTAGAPSTSPGIGIEVWLPTTQNWNQRIRNLGGGGWAGGPHASTALIGNVQGAATAAVGYVVGTTDTGHSIGNGAFAMREDGTINTALWRDFAERSLHQLALKTKTLTKAYYGQRQRYAYWEGCSTGGRQGYKIAQEHPGDYDGYLNGMPAFNWSRFITNELYPQTVMLRDLGAPMAGAKLNAVSAAATNACDVVGGQHLGFILDPSQCRYDPTRDAGVLCNGVAGNGVTGTNTSASCVNLAEARAINKIWYGQTADGSVPDPAADNASSPLLQPKQLWWGLNRGTFLGLLAGEPSAPPFFGPFPIATDQVALELQDPTIATPSFLNTTGNGANQWTQLSYADLANAYDRGIALQPSFGRINTDNPDLRRAKYRGAKIVTYHGWSDVLIPPLGSINYFERVSQVVGGATETNKFNRLYMIPGEGHCGGVGAVGPNANPNTVPLPANDQFFNALVGWVENRTAPNALVLKSADASVSMPICPYPQKATYSGSGAITAASSYACK
jgi:Tannase and feruloyl esterase